MTLFSTEAKVTEHLPSLAVCLPYGGGQCFLLGPAEEKLSAQQRGTIDKPIEERPSSRV